MDRRTFLKFAGIGSLSVAVGCSSQPDKTIYSLVRAPDDMVTGKESWYASTCRECPAGCGVIARNREGRVVKVEGNPLHPINQGKICMRGQSALQAIYNPDRIKTPLIKNGDRRQALSFAEAEAVLQEKVQAASRQKGGVRMITEVPGESTLRVMNRFLDSLNAPEPLLYEPFAYESLKTANRIAFGREGLPSYRMQDADFLLCFGADFLETWLSPVEYAGKFKEMHAYKGGRKPLFYFVSPYQSMTGANADHWLAPVPGGETAVVLGCIREALRRGKGGALPGSVVSFLKKKTESYAPEQVAAEAGIAPHAFQELVRHLLAAKRPLVLGPGTAAADSALDTHVAVNLLNMILDPYLSLFDFSDRHRVELAATGAEVREFFEGLDDKTVSFLLINNVNPAFSLPEAARVREILSRDSLFTVCFSNFMDETAELADLVFPVQLPLERWGEYGGKHRVVSTLQPTMGNFIGAPSLSEVLLGSTASPIGGIAEDIQTVLIGELVRDKKIESKGDWLHTVQRGGVFDNESKKTESPELVISKDLFKRFEKTLPTAESGHGDHTAAFMAAPSIRFFDGRGANRPWLSEIPDPLTKVAWQSPVLLHPDTLKGLNAEDGDFLTLKSKSGELKAPAYGFTGVRPGLAVMTIGQGHSVYGRYAEAKGANPFRLLSHEAGPVSGAPAFVIPAVSIEKAGGGMTISHTDGSKFQHDRKIALSVGIHELGGHGGHHGEEHGFGMHEFPLTLPLPEGYAPHRDLYPPHGHQNDYRWGMIVDLDRCIGCAACAAACYAENNLGVVGEERIIEGREMSWMRVERYHDQKRMEKITFFPMFCQHCDNAPCESVCPVYAPHHGKEGINNQIYNRCIGTRYCSQNCPYKVRRFNWFKWEWPEPLNRQLNPDVTVRTKGVMEKCSFCVQRIKTAHGKAKDEKRRILDGEVMPACVQTCPTNALIFGNLADKNSRVRRLTENPRAYQVMGYLNTKPAVIYLKKVVQEI